MFHLQSTKDPDQPQQIKLPFNVCTQFFVSQKALFAVLSATLNSLNVHTTKTMHLRPNYSTFQHKRPWTHIAANAPDNPFRNCWPLLLQSTPIFGWTVVALSKLHAGWASSSASSFCSNARSGLQHWTRVLLLVRVAITRVATLRVCEPMMWRKFTIGLQPLVHHL